MTIRYQALAAFFTTLMIYATAGPAQAQFEFDPSFQVRFRGITINPNEKETIEPIGGAADVSTEWVPEIDLTFFYNDNISVELIAAIAEHDVEIIDSALGNISEPDLKVVE